MESYLNDTKQSTAKTYLSQKKLPRFFAFPHIAYVYGEAIMHTLLSDTRYLRNLFRSHAVRGNECLSNFNHAK
jgi:hypothetical protein